jgi:hypothetical protein
MQLNSNFKGFTMLTPYTERQKTMIVNNVIKAVKDPDKLSKQAYKYLYLCSGFMHIITTGL